jgi:hypothetical protein
MKGINQQTALDLRFEVSMVVKTDTLVFWVMTSYSLVCGHQRFTVTYCLQLPPILKTEVVCSEILIPTYQTIQCYNPEDHNVNKSIPLKEMPNRIWMWLPADSVTRTISDWDSVQTLPA